MSTKTKNCRYGCGIRIGWKNNKGWVEEGTEIVHSYRRCAEIQKSQGKQVSFPKNV